MTWVQPTERGTCPVCHEQAWLSVTNGRTMLAHHVPRWMYKDGRGCYGAGLVAIEKRKRLGPDQTHPGMPAL